MRNPSCNCAQISLLLVAAVAWLPRTAAADPFAACEQGFTSHPWAQESALCFFDVAKRETMWSEAMRRLERHRLAHPDNPWLQLYLGHVFLFQDRPRAESSYRDAVRLASGGIEAEIESRLALVRYLSQEDLFEEARDTLEPAIQIAEVLLAKVRIRQAFLMYYEGRDLDAAYRLLQLIEPQIRPEWPVSVKKAFNDAMSSVCNVLGLNEDVRKYKEQALAMALQANDLAWEASARFAIAVQYYTAELPSSETRQTARELFQSALTAAEAAGHPSIAGLAHHQLGRIVGGDEGRRHLETCLGIASELGDLKLLNACRGALAVSFQETDPERARELIEEMIAAASDSDPWLYNWKELVSVYWATLLPSEALDRSFEILGAFETLRELQRSGLGRASFLSAWADPYYWISGRLLLEAQSPDQGHGRNLNLAFQVIERMRARVLLEALEAASAVQPPSPAEPSIQQLAEILQQKVAVQKRLSDTALKGAARAGTVAELEKIELRESEVRHQITVASPSYIELRPSDLASLEDVEQSLADDEALFSYQIGQDEEIDGRFAGKAWLQVATRSGTRIYRMPGLANLEPRLERLVGLEDPGSVEPALVSLYDDLLASAITDLPDHVDNLIIIPDGQLHRLPFALLRRAVGADPLVADYQLSIIPSATLWLRWRKLDPPTSTAPVLVFADPDLASQEPTDPANSRAWDLARGVQLAPLLYAREEGRAVVRILGGESRLLEREEATETSVKTEELQRFGIVHFAAHTIIDPQKPERSAVFLAPSEKDPDGWLQPQEIVQLDLDGRVVVLASCDTAAGQILRGEGAMSLARSFFQAGAPVVVASLWQLPDDKTSALFEEFYRRLARGASVAEAMAMAQCEMIQRGATGKEWAGLVVLGDGSLVPFPGGLPRPIPYRLITTVGLALAVLAAIVLWRRRSLQT